MGCHTSVNLDRAVDRELVDEDDWSFEAVERSARIVRASWREECEELCREEGCPTHVKELARRLITCIDETEGMYHGEPPKIKKLLEMYDVMEKLSAEFE